MLLYKVRYHHRDNGECLEWETTRALAVAAKRRIKGELSDNELQSDVVIDPEKIPTDKAGLARWLNMNFNRDNG